MRIVNEHTKTEKTWMQWTTKAFRSVYGYEFQGDSLLIARINLLMPFADYVRDKALQKHAAKWILPVTGGCLTCLAADSFPG